MREHESLLEVDFVFTKLHNLDIVVQVLDYGADCEPDRAIIALTEGYRIDISIRVVRVHLVLVFL